MRPLALNNTNTCTLATQLLLFSLIVQQTRHKYETFFPCNDLVAHLHVVLTDTKLESGI